MRDEWKESVVRNISWYFIRVSRSRGRRSLSGAGDSPQLRLRLPEELRDSLTRLAAAQDVTVSELARAILADAVNSAGPAAPGTLGRMSGPLGTRLRIRRQEVLATAADFGLTNLRVFGSVARGEERPGSDIDLLADVPNEMSLVRFGQIQSELERILDARVDLVPAAGLKVPVGDEVGRDVVALSEC